MRFGPETVQIEIDTTQLEAAASRMENAAETGALRARLVELKALASAVAAREEAKARGESPELLPTSETFITGRLVGALTARLAELAAAMPVGEEAARLERAFPVLRKFLPRLLKHAEPNAGGPPGWLAAVFVKELVETVTGAGQEPPCES